MLYKIIDENYLKVNHIKFYSKYDYSKYWKYLFDIYLLTYTTKNNMNRYIFDKFLLRDVIKL